MFRYTLRFFRLNRIGKTKWKHFISVLSLRYIIGIVYKREYFVPKHVLLTKMKPTFYCAPSITYESKGKDVWVNVNGMSVFWKMIELNINPVYSVRISIEDTF